MKMILVTAYETPDLDGSACAYAYAELLSKQGKKASYGIFGDLRHEAIFPFDYLGIKPPSGEKLLEKADSIILTDASELIGISPNINPEIVIEIIDHRKSNDAEKFKNAKSQIELVGACATLVCERFVELKVKPSRESAVLLYLAILSNTINLKNKITSERDIQAVAYLSDLYKIDEELIRQFFNFKSDLTSKTISEIFKEDGFINIYAGKPFTIFQIEIIGVDEFVEQNYQEIIRELEKIKEQHQQILFFLSCIDIEKAQNTFVSSDTKAQDFLSKTFELKFKNNIAKKNGIIMRKEIVPLVKEYLN